MRADICACVCLRVLACSRVRVCACARVCPRTRACAGAEHGARHGLDAERLREQNLDGRVDALRNRDHHLRPEDPENVVEEESGEEHATDHVRAERDHLDALDGEGDAQHVVEPPRLGDGVRDRDGGRADEDEHVDRVEVEVQRVCACAQEPTMRGAQAGRGRKECKRAYMGRRLTVRDETRRRRVQNGANMRGRRG
eukprot:576283-Pleurochrysis_carterae.AAC.2